MCSGFALEAELPHGSCGKSAFLVILQIWRTASSLRRCCLEHADTYAVTYCKSFTGTLPKSTTRVLIRSWVRWTVALEAFGTWLAWDRFFLDEFASTFFIGVGNKSSITLAYPLAPPVVSRAYTFFSRHIVNLASKFCFSLLEVGTHQNKFFFCFQSNDNCLTLLLLLYYEHWIAPFFSFFFCWPVKAILFNYYA